MLCPRAEAGVARAVPSGRVLFLHVRPSPHRAPRGRPRAQPARETKRAPPLSSLLSVLVLPLSGRETNPSVRARGMAALQSLSCSTLCDPDGTSARQAPLSMEIPRKEYWGGLPFPPSPGTLPEPEIKPTSALQADSFTTEPPGRPGVPR